MGNEVIPTVAAATGPCRCGCGEHAPLSDRTDPTRGSVRGQPVYLMGHWLRGKRSNGWRGGISQQNGYPIIYMPDHPRADVAGYVKMHILVAERALGKPLPTKAIVHHVNEDVSDYRNANLVICQNVAYHRLLHRRMETKRACGRADWQRCAYCGQHGPLKTVHKCGDAWAHYDCYRLVKNTYQRQYRSTLQRDEAR